ncbi:MAG: 2-amino-4-hydroxy-6-hydroxymethyldihydropteridine diphosphokinase [Steroidobacteraceae bacterium]|nr:2-amino-4-hydroxy-6-hydroxymethyldihydropteridine diphosphokinase [Steroidobacteraceae bacterium]
MTTTERDESRAHSERGTWIPAYVALGSNLDDPRLQVERAFEALERLPLSRLLLRSHCYRSRPMGPVAQADFVNAAAGLLTQLDAPTLLDALKTLESQLGRAAPVVRWGPRRIDLDLLVHGSTRLQAPAIQVPHPGIAERAFVLVPLCDLSPSLVVPGVGRVSGLLRRIDASGLERIDA